MEIAIYATQCHNGKKDCGPQHNSKHANNFLMLCQRIQRLLSSHTQRNCVNKQKITFSVSLRNSRRPTPPPLPTRSRRCTCGTLAEEDQAMDKLALLLQTTTIRMMVCASCLPASRPSGTLYRISSTSSSRRPKPSQPTATTTNPTILWYHLRTSKHKTPKKIKSVLVKKLPRTNASSVLLQICTISCVLMEGCVGVCPFTLRQLLARRSAPSRIDQKRRKDNQIYFGVGASLNPIAVRTPFIAPATRAAMPMVVATLDAPVAEPATA